MFEKRTTLTPKRVFGLLAFGVAALTFLTACSPDSSSKPGDGANWPTRNVNLIVYSSAGGATDLANRALAEGMKETLGVDVVASNMPGALGGTATNYVWNQRHDGNTLVGISEGALAHSVLGLHTTTAKDWRYFMVGGTPGILSVRADSPFLTFEDLLTAVRDEPGHYTIATSVPGSVWNIQWLNTKRLGFDVRFIPYKGSFPSQTAVLSGEVNMVWTGLGEQADFIKSGDLRPLVVFSDEALDFGGRQIPAITASLPELKSVMPIEQFVGFAVPADTPEAVVEKLTASFEAAMASDVLRQFSEAKHTPLIGLHGEAANQAALRQEQTVVWTLQDEGIATVNPETLGIARP